MAVIPTEEEMAELSTRGQAVCETKKSLLEPEFNNQYVAIHVDMGNYAVAKSSAAATRALHQRHPPERAYRRKVGNEPENGLAARLLVGEMMAGHTHGTAVAIFGYVYPVEDTFLDTARPMTL